MFAQMTSFHETTFCKYQCRLRKGFTTQHCFPAKPKKWKKKKKLDKGQHLIVSTMNFLLQNWIYMVLVTCFKHINNYLLVREREKQSVYLMTGSKLFLKFYKAHFLDLYYWTWFLSGLFFYVDDVEIPRYEDNNTLYVSSKGFWFESGC